MDNTDGQHIPQFGHSYEEEKGSYINQDMSELARLLRLYALNTEDIGTTCMIISMFLHLYKA